MTNKVQIVVSGKNEFKPTETAVIAGIMRIKTVADAATKAAAKFDQQLNSPKTSAVDKVAASLDKAGKAADKARDKIGGIGDRLDSGGNKLSGWLKKHFTNAGEVSDGLTNMLPKALSNPAVLAAAAGGTFVGAAAGGAIVLGLGAGLAASGIVAASHADRVKLAWRHVGTDIGRDMRSIAQPFERTLTDISAQAEQAFATLKPSLQRAFGAMAPDVTKFSQRLFSSFDGSSIEPIQRAFSAVIDDLGVRMPAVVDDLADGFVDLSKSIEKNPQALGQMLEMLSGLGGSVMSDLGALNDNFGDVNGELEMISNWFTGKGYELDITVASNFDGNIADRLRGIASSFDAAGGSSYRAKDPVGALDEAFLRLADTEGTVASRGQAMTDVLDRLAGRTSSYEESTQAINDRIRALNDTFADAANHADGYGSALLNADGSVNTVSSNGSRLQDIMIALKGAFSNAAMEVRTLEDAGWSHDAAINQVNADLSTQRDSLMATAGKIGLTRGEMERLLAAYGLTPEEIKTRLSADTSTFERDVERATRDRQLRVFMSTFSSGTGYGARPGPEYAHGGVVSGGWTTVGEMGPERVKLPPGAQVQAFTASQRQLEPSGVGTGGGGGWAPTLNLAGMPPAGTGRQFIDWLTGELRRQGVKLVRT